MLFPKHVLLEEGEYSGKFRVSRKGDSGRGGDEQTTSMVFREMSKKGFLQAKSIRIGAWVPGAGGWGIVQALGFP